MGESRFLLASAEEVTDRAYDIVWADATEFKNRKRGWNTKLTGLLQKSRGLLSDRGILFLCLPEDCCPEGWVTADRVMGKDKRVAALTWERCAHPALSATTPASATEKILVYAADPLHYEGLSGMIREEESTFPCVNASSKREIRRIPAGVDCNYKHDNYFLPTGAVLECRTTNLYLHSDLMIFGGKLMQDVLLEGNWIYPQEALDAAAARGDLYLTRDMYFRMISRTPKKKQLKDFLPAVGDNPAILYETDPDPLNLLADGWGTNEDAVKELELANLSAEEIASPKPVKLLTKLLLAAGAAEHCISVLPGAGVLAAAVREANRIDGGSRSSTILMEKNDVSLRNRIGFYPESI